MDNGNPGNGVRVSFPRGSTEGEVIFQHIWLVTSASGAMPRQKTSLWAYFKAAILFSWVALTVLLIIDPKFVDILTYCAHTMGTGLVNAALPNHKKRNSHANINQIQDIRGIRRLLVLLSGKARK